MGDDEYLSIEEAAERLSVDYKTIYRLVRSGEIPAARIGRVYRIKGSDLNEFFERSKAVQMGVVCSSCGETILSVLGIAGACEECAAPLCVKCMKVGRAVRCSEHAGEGAGRELPG
ncbi:MAG: helix-turn-helix domain-containing protein [Planctomycetota bacterium]